jgi:hypothetical protein
MAVDAAGEIILTSRNIGHYYQCDIGDPIKDNYVHTHCAIDIKRS